MYQQMWQLMQHAEKASTEQQQLAESVSNEGEARFSEQLLEVIRYYMVSGVGG